MIRTHFTLLVLGLFCIAWLPRSAHAEGHADNVVFQQLLKKGVPLSNGKTVKLPAPVLGDDLNAEQQLAAIEKVVPAGKMKGGFMFGARSDPWYYQLDDVTGANQGANASIGRKINLYFVAQGKLSTVASKDFIKKQIEQEGGNNKEKAEFYTDEELEERNLEIVDRDDLKERYGHAVLRLFGMVDIGGSGHAMQSRNGDSVVAAFQLDPRFANDPKYPNQWWPLDRGATGALSRGKPQPYAGAGAYVKVTELKDKKSKDRVFIEYHLVFDEPHGWFGGAATLSSKLPQQYENDVRKFRVNLKQYEQRNPQANAEQADQASPILGSTNGTSAIKSDDAANHLATAEKQSQRRTQASSTGTGSGNFIGQWGWAAAAAGVIAVILFAVVRRPASSHLHSVDARTTDR